MPFSAGTTLGPYEIVAPIGQGGMGVVYKARDKRLNRFVAIKVLPGANAADEERRRRFLQEAQAASALNHPNIITIHDIGSTEAIDYIAMEYVGGKTLDALIPRKGMRLNEVLHIAIQIAAGLQRAHAACIVHRDLKPGNVVVADDGTVKVLDFGLAKLAQPSLTAAAAGEEYQTETVRPSTKEGAILGTVGYMSPEQAEAKPVDCRSDIFSFGSIVYEMVTGQRAFRGDSTLSTLAAILKENPEPVSTVVPDVPRDLEKIINRCLRKDPDRRFQHMDDVRIALLELKEESDSGLLVSGEARERRRRPRLIWAVATSIVAIAGLAGLGYWVASRSHAPPLRITPLTTSQGLQRDPALSPDGREVAFSWAGESGSVPHIHVKLVDAGPPLPLTNEAHAADRYPAWSPDGRYLAFCRKSPQAAQIMSISALGGSAKKLADVADCADLGFEGVLSWSSDGKWLAAADRSSNGVRAISLISADTGEKRLLGSPPPGFEGDRHPVFSPDGRHLAFIRDPSHATGDLYVVPYADGQAGWAQLKRLTNTQRTLWGFDWTADGRDLVYSNVFGRIWAVSVGGGEPRAVAVPGNAIRLSVSRTGNRMVFEKLSVDLNIWRMAGPASEDIGSGPAPLIASTEFDDAPQYSPDGTKILFISSRFGAEEIWTADADGHNEVPLTSFGCPAVTDPRWSSDGRLIAFACSAPGVISLYVVNAEGGKPRRLTNHPSSASHPSWSRDGRWIYFGSDRTGQTQIWKISAAGGEAVQVTHGGGLEGFESLDGRFLYFAKPAGIWRMPVSGGDETQVLKVSGDAGVDRAWVRGGEFEVAPPGLWFWDVSASDVAQLKYLDEASGRVTIFRELSKGAHLFGDGFSISPDRRWILYTQIDRETSNLMLVDNFR